MAINLFSWKLKSKKGNRQKTSQCRIKYFVQRYHHIISILRNKQNSMVFLVKLNLAIFLDFVCCSYFITFVLVYFCLHCRSFYVISIFFAWRLLVKFSLIFTAICLKTYLSIWNFNVVISETTVHTPCVNQLKIFLSKVYSNQIDRTNFAVFQDTGR